MNKRQAKVFVRSMDINKDGEISFQELVDRLRQVSSCCAFGAAACAEQLRPRPTSGHLLRSAS